MSATVLACPAPRITPGNKKLLRARDARAHARPHWHAALPRGRPGRAGHHPRSKRPHPPRRTGRLGITRSGALMPVPGSTPLGRALRGLGVRRERHDVEILTPRCTDASGARLAIRSTALLRAADGEPLAWVTERVYARFLEEFPPPWTGLQPATAATGGAVLGQPRDCRLRELTRFPCTAPAAARCTGTRRPA